MAKFLEILEKISKSNSVNLKDIEPNPEIDKSPGTQYKNKICKTKDCGEEVTGRGDYCQECKDKNYSKRLNKK